MSVEAVVGSYIRLSTAYLQREVVASICDALTLNNKEKEEALKWGEDGADDLDDFIYLYEWTENDVLVLPRGFASQLTEGLAAFGIDLEWQDERRRVPYFHGGTPIPARDYQEKIIAAVLEAEQGIVKAPTGSGKTVAALEIFRRIGGNALVIVNTKEIAQQWMDRCRTWLGDDYPVTLIGDNEFEVSDGLTVAIQGTLWSRFQKLRAQAFFDHFQAVCLDECHHATARTYKTVVNEFSSALRFGMSATPEKTGDFRLALNVLGPVVVEITDAEVESQIVTPEVHVIETDFGRSNGKAMPGQGMRGIAYEVILRKLAGNKDRNRMIARNIVHHHADNANLVLSKRIGHLSNIWEALVDEGFDPDDILTIVGMDSRAERKIAVERIEEAHCVVLSTLADEALDAPRLDRLHITFPTANPDLLVQQVGRVRRRHPRKADALVIDYRDINVATLNKQYMTRRHDVYNPRGFRVMKIGKP